MDPQPHATTCSSLPYCLRLENPAVVGSAFDSVRIKVLQALCRQAGVSCPSGLTKAAIANRVIQRAQQLANGITARSCTDARAEFVEVMGGLTVHILRSSADDDNSISVPWHSEPVRIVVLKAVLDAYNMHTLRAFASSFNTPEKISAYRKDDLMTHLVSCLEVLLNKYNKLNHLQLRDCLVDLYECEPPQDMTYSDTMLCVIDCEIPEDLLSSFMTATTSPDLRMDEKHRVEIQNVQRERLVAVRDRMLDCHLHAFWPKKVHDMTRIACMSRYHKASAFSFPSTCCSCGRRRIGYPVVTYNSRDDLHINLDALRCSGKDNWLLARADRLFRYAEDPCLDGLVFERAGLRFSENSGTEMDFCIECEGSLRHGTVPKFALANGLYRGILPDDMRDLTWVEEQVCALYVGSTNVARLFGSKDPKNPFVFYGNTCAHPQNVVQTMDVLPRTVGNVADNIAVIFVGPGTYRPRVFEKTFRDVQIDESRLAAYPEDGALPGIENRVVHDDTADPEQQLDEETAAFEEHPAFAAQRLQPDWRPHLRRRSINQSAT